MKCTKTLKIKIKRPIDNEWKDIWKILKDLRYNTSKVMNFTIQKCYEWHVFRNNYKEKSGVFPKVIDIHGIKSFSGYLYRECSKKFKIFNTQNLSQTYDLANKKWNSDIKDVLSLKKTIPNYKLNVPIMLHNNSVKLKNNGDYFASISLLSKAYAKEELKHNKTQFRFELVVKDKSTKTILDRIIAGQYKQGYCQIAEKKNKWYLFVAYNFEAEKGQIEKNRIMGIDLGINYPAYMAFNDSLHRYKIKGGEIEQFRKQIEIRKNELLNQGKYCGNGRRGHGIKTRIKPIEAIKGKIKNFRDTTNHKYSRFVIDMAVKHNVETIQMEKLEGINEESTFLKNWSYYDLQQKIEYKAKEKGIKVKYIDPKYTSQRCSKCGNIHKDNRKEQKTFECVACGFTTNADYNAAKNISKENINKKIKEYLG